MADAALAYDQKFSYADYKSWELKPGEFYRDAGVREYWVIDMEIPLEILFTSA
jgi:hypothetical protein